MRRFLSPLLLAAFACICTGCGRQPVSVTSEQEYSIEIHDAVPATRSAQTIPAETTVSAVPEETAAPEQTESVPEQTKSEPETSYAVTLTQSETTVTTEAVLDKDGVYTTKEDVALYIYTYGELPSNFITKKQAQKLGWSGGSLEPYAPGCCIGGTYFGNYEGILPEADGRTYTECDIDTLGKKSRGAKRIVFSNDGLIYYTEDHYKTFELLYGEESE